MIRILAVLLGCLVVSAGCHRSNNAEVGKAMDSAADSKRGVESLASEVDKTSEAQPTVDADRQAAEWVLDANGSIRIVVDGVESHVKTLAELPTNPFQLIGVRFEWGNDKVTDDAIAALARATNLVDLTLGGAGNFGDAGARHLRDLKGLYSLALDGTQLSDLGIESIAALPKLESLTINGTKVTDNGLQKLSELKTLKVLWLSHTAVTDAGLLHVARLPKLEVIQLADTKVTDAGVAALKSELPNLRVDGRK